MQPRVGGAEHQAEAGFPQGCSGDVGQRHLARRGGREADFGAARLGAAAGGEGGGGTGDAGGEVGVGQPQRVAFAQHHLGQAAVGEDHHLQGVLGFGDIEQQAGGAAEFDALAAQCGQHGQAGGEILRPQRQAAEGFLLQVLRRQRDPQHGACGVAHQQAAQHVIDLGGGDGEGGGFTGVERPGAFDLHQPGIGKGDGAHRQFRRGGRQGEQQGGGEEGVLHPATVTSVPEKSSSLKSLGRFRDRARAKAKQSPVLRRWGGRRS